MFEKYLGKVVDKENLKLKEMEEAMQMIMEGGTSESQIAGFLVGLRMKGETTDEITAAAKVMRDKALPVNYSKKMLVDTCGTGGDGKGTFNISTIVAIIMAGAGLTVAKHGNRSVSSKCGSADLLEALGINIELTPEQVQKCLDEIGIGFLFAPFFHKAMKYAIGPRKELGLRTIFNILGPLTNPARADYQILGVYHPDLVLPLAEVLKNLGVRSAMVVHGKGGIDEFSLQGTSKVAYLKNGMIEEFYLSPEKAGLYKIDIENIKGGNTARNKEIALSILNGEKGPKRDVVLLNAAAAFLVTGEVDTWEDGVRLAAYIIDSRKARDKLDEMIDFSSSFEVVT